MALPARTELDQVHRLARVELEDVADAVREAERVGRLLDEPLATEPFVFGPRRLERSPVPGAEAGLLDLVRNVGSEVRREPLPLAREQAVPLQVAEGAVVGDDLEAVGERLEAAPRPMPPVLARADEIPDECGTLLRGQPRDRRQRLLLAPGRRLVHERREQLLLGAVR